MNGCLLLASAALTVLGGMPVAGGARDARQAEAMPPGIRDIGIDERLGAQLPRDVALWDHRGQEVTLADYLDAGQPILLVPAYYGCPMLCSLVLNAVSDLSTALHPQGWVLGEDYRIAVFSFDPEDGPVQARRKWTAVLDRHGTRVPDADWPFLTARPGTRDLLLEAIGLRVHQDPRTGEWAHPATLVVLDPSGRVATYLHGTDYDLDTAVAALEDARAGLTRTPLERLLIACFRYDPASRAFGGVVIWSLRLGGLAIVLALGGLVGILILRERRTVERQA